VDLVNPAHTFRVFVGRRAYLTHELYDRDMDDFEERAVKHRPFFKPVSLHPKFARTLVNLSRVHDGQHLLDPFCGTAGILIEAGLVGAHPVGIDADPEAAAGARLNLEHFGVLGTVVHDGRAKDARAIVGHEVAAVATDPPYGRSATTMKAGPRAVIEESAPGIVDVLRPGGMLAMCVPDLELARPFEGLLARRLLIEQRVHASLTRHYLLFEKGA
jgi:tRNA (guanine10-N2)-dimethyltransferase